MRPLRPPRGRFIVRPVNDIVRTALIALVAVVVAKKVLPMVPGGDQVAKHL